MKCKPVGTTRIDCAATLLICAGLSWWMLPSGSAAPPAGASTPKAAPWIAQAYERTKTANGVAEFGAIIELIEKGLATSPSETTADYARRLLSWALNRRGELYAEQAAQNEANGQPGQRQRLDQLAYADFVAAIRYDPHRWKAIHNRGVSYALRGQYDEALRDFNKVTELKPDYGNAWFNRGEIRYERGQLEGAIADYNQAMRLMPEDKGVLTSRGHAYYRLGQFDDAIADYQRAAELDPQDAELLANRGDGHVALKHWEQAAADYRHAIELNDHLVHAYRSAAWLMATCPDARYRDPDLAVHAAQKALTLDTSQHYQTLDTLAAAYASAGQFDQARETLSRAIDKAPAKLAPGLVKRLSMYQRQQPFRLAGGLPE